MPNIDPSALFKFTYGLFVITTKAEGRDNGCITNTAMQMAMEPQCIAVSLVKQNLTHDMVLQSGKFNLSILDQTAPFSLFQHYGFQSGRNVDKFADMKLDRLENGIYVLKEHVNAHISADVKITFDCGSNTLFVAELKESHILSQTPSISYEYYHKHVKPSPQKQEKKGYVCRICGYVHEGEDLPPDIVCPICKHGAADFEKI